MSKEKEINREQELLATIKSLKDENNILSSKLAAYENDGVEKLLNSLQRKANEMADLLNKYKLTDIDIDDRQSKAFERIKVVWTDAKTISESIQALKMATMKTDTEDKKPIVEKKALTVEGIADLYGNKAGQK